MQTVYLDISNKNVTPILYAKQKDVGRKFLAVITESSLPRNISENDAFSVWYCGDSGEGNYTHIGEKSAFSVSKNRVEVELITQMLSNSGGGVLSLVLHSADGNQIGLWNIQYCVESVPGIESEEAKTYYTAFSETVGNAIDAAARAEQAAESLENITPESIGSAPATEDSTHRGCYYRIVSGNTEWINPPVEIGEEYRTTERWNGYAVYTKLIDLGTIPSGEKTVEIGVSGIAMSGLPGMIRHYAFTNTGRSVLPHGKNVGDWEVSVNIHDGVAEITGGSGIGNNNELLYLQMWYIKP